ncbi:MAG: membrane dipeptidase, partial [Bacilli bacterium]|nr:membrane dipeptidase [Bacilli bacterium]
VDGLLGLTLAGNFVTKKKEEQTVDHFLDHLDRAVELIGVENVAFGFDFMDYFTEDFPDSNLRDVTDVRYVHLIVKEMRRRGYSTANIAKIGCNNFYSRYQSKIYRSEKI